MHNDIKRTSYMVTRRRTNDENNASIVFDVADDDCTTWLMPDGDERDNSRNYQVN